MQGEAVFFNSGCDCSWSPPRPSSFGEIAAWFEMQRSDEIRSKLMEGFRGGKSGETP